MDLCLSFDINVAVFALSPFHECTIAFHSENFPLQSCLELLFTWLN